MSIVTYCRAERASLWATYHGDTIEQSCKEYAATRLTAPHQTEQIHWWRDDGTHGTVTATLRHDIEITGMRGEHQLEIGDRVEIKDYSWTMEVVDMNCPRTYRTGTGRLVTLGPMRATVVEQGEYPVSERTDRVPQSENDTLIKADDGRHICISSGYLQKVKSESEPLRGSVLGWSQFNSAQSHHEHDPGATLNWSLAATDQWRTHCPSKEEVADNQYVDVSYTDNGRTRVLRITGRTLRLSLSQRIGVYAWMPLPAAAEPPYEPPTGWQDYREREPCAKDSDAAGEVLVDCGDGCLDTCDWSEVGEFAANAADQSAVRWCTTKWARERE